MEQERAVKAAGSTHDLARVALAEDWALGAAIADVGHGEVDDAIERYEAGMLPLAVAEPELMGPGAETLRTWLKPIGMKISPTMSGAVCTTWLSAVMMALSDFPAKVAAQAARVAIRTPMQFLNEVDGHVRAEAEKIMARHRTAIMRLKRMRAEIERAAVPPQPLLAAPEDGATPLSVEELRAMPADLRRIGLAQGWIDQADLDAADGQRAAAA